MHMKYKLTMYIFNYEVQKEAYVEAKKVVDQMREDKHNFQIKLQKIVETSETSRVNIYFQQKVTILFTHKHMFINKDI